MKLRVFAKDYDDDWGQSLADFLIDPTLHLDRGYGGDGPSSGIESRIHRLWSAHAKLLELLVSKGQITMNEALVTLDVDTDLNRRYEIKEIKDD